VKGSALLVVAAVIGVAACQEVTSPSTEADLTVRNALRSNPPPPPIDTGASFFQSAFLTSAPTGLRMPAVRTNMLSAPTIGFRNAEVVCDGNINNGTVPLRHFFNKTNQTGWDHFESDCDNGVDATAGAATDFHRGVITGRGTLTINTYAGTLVVDLSSVDSDASSMGPCQGFIIGDLAPDGVHPAAVAPADTGCFDLKFDNVTLDGVQVGPYRFEESCYESCEFTETALFDNKRIFG
jgi:hypothetical protein